MAPADGDNLYPFPRIHPLWHKSQADFDQPDMSTFGRYTASNVQAYEVVLEEGDILYIPPYYWHHVEALTPSVSLSPWSRLEVQYQAMNNIYKRKHSFDQMGSPERTRSVLRLFIDMLVEQVIGVGRTRHFIAHLLNTRFTGVAGLFPIAQDDARFCPKNMAVSSHVFSSTRLDIEQMSSEFAKLNALPEIRDILLADYIEELTSNVVGVNKTLAFLRYCFLDQKYVLDKVNDRPAGMFG